MKSRSLLAVLLATLVLLAGQHPGYAGAQDTPGAGAARQAPIGQQVATETPVPPSPVPGNATGTPVGGPVRSVELPAGRAVSMSPDGRYLAAAVPPQTSLCVYDVETMAEVSCADLSVLNTSIRVEDVVWSPDSTRIAFSEQTFVTFKDGDLWVMDAASGALTDLTDDGYVDGIALLQDEVDVEFFVDVSPAWTPDGKFITFSRTLSDAEGVTDNVIAQIPAGGGEVETLAFVSDIAGTYYFRAHWSPDGARFYYSVTYQDPQNPDSGIWVYDAATGTTELLAGSADPEELGPLVLSEVSSDGSRLLAWYPLAVQSQTYLGRSPLTFVDAMTGELSPVPDPAPESEIFAGTWIATLSPDGQYLLQAVGLDMGSADYWITNLATGESTQVASDLEDAVPVYYGLTPVWGANGTVFVSWNVIGAYFFPIDGAGISADFEVDTSKSGTPVAAAGEFAEGDDVVTNGVTPIFAGPDIESPLAYVLPAGRIVHILGDPVYNEEETWYPIFDPVTQIIGYVPADRLETTA